jgi:integrase
MRVPLTDLFCKTAKTEKANGENFWDTRTEGLLLRVLQSGSKVFYFKYRSPVRRVATANGGAIGWQASYRIGSFDAICLKQARKIALRLAADVADGKDPAADRAADLRRMRKAHSFNELSDQWLEEHAHKTKVPRAAQDDESMLRIHVRPLIGVMKADTVTKNDVRGIVSRIVARGTMYRANRVLQLIRTIYRWGLSHERVTIDPTLGIKLPHVEEARDRVLTVAEIRKAWLGIPAVGGSPTVEAMIRLELLLGLRTAEIARLAKANIDLEAVPPRLCIVREHSKNKRPHFVPLPKIAVEIVRACIARSGDSEWLLPSPRDARRHVYRYVASRFLTIARDNLGVPDFNTHDLRRTMATYLDDELEIGIEEIKRVLNHVDAPGATGHYIHPKKLKKKMRVLAAWDEYLSKLLAEAELKVIHVDFGEVPRSVACLGT